MIPGIGALLVLPGVFVKGTSWIIFRAGKIPGVSVETLTVMKNSLPSGYTARTQQVPGQDSLPEILSEGKCLEQLRLSGCSAV
jgi:hypothetical protein